MRNLRKHRTIMPRSNPLQPFQGKRMIPLTRGIQGVNFPDFVKSIQNKSYAQW